MSWHPTVNAVELNKTKVGVDGAFFNFTDNLIFNLGNNFCVVVIFSIDIVLTGGDTLNKAFSGQLRFVYPAFSTLPNLNFAPGADDCIYSHSIGYLAPGPERALI